MLLEAIPSSEKETNPWLSAEARFDDAAERLGLDDGMQKSCAPPRARSPSIFLCSSTTGGSKCSPAIACSIRSRAGRQRAAFATRPT